LQFETDCKWKSDEGQQSDLSKIAADSYFSYNMNRTLTPEQRKDTS